MMEYKWNKAAYELSKNAFKYIYTCMKNNK